LTRLQRREAHTDKRLCQDGGWCQAPPHCESHFWTHPRKWKACSSKCPSLDEGQGCRPLPHHVESFPDSPTTVGGAHWHASMPRRRGGVPAAATLRKAVLGLAHDDGRRAPASIHIWTGGRRGVVHRHTTRSRSRTRPRWWEARTGKREGVLATATPRGTILDSPTMVGGTLKGRDGRLEEGE
jgi:hypothetical protein